METFSNITITGTSHIAKESIKEVDNTIAAMKPDFVAIELDAGRARGLEKKMKRPKNMALLKQLGLSGFLFYLVGEFVQKKLGKIVNVEPGSDMRSALKAAKKNNCYVVFIDRDISITLRRFSRYFRKREILWMIRDYISSIFIKKEKMSIDISKIPSEELIERAMKETREKYPSLYKVLVDERDRYMALMLFKLSKSAPEKKIYAVVGAGHVKGILNYLSKLSEANLQ